MALVRLPRRRRLRNLRRLATLGVVGGVLCATLGLAVYSASRSDDCPRDAAVHHPPERPRRAPADPRPATARARDPVRTCCRAGPESDRIVSRNVRAGASAAEDDGQLEGATSSSWS